MRNAIDEFSITPGYEGEERRKRIEEKVNTYIIESLKKVIDEETFAATKEGRRLNDIEKNYRD